MASPFDHPAQSVCILRLSAIGDTCHVLPVVRTLQRAWPDTRFTWVIGRLEAKLLGHIPDIEFIVVDKGSTLKAIRSLRKAMQGRRFDVLMHMQLSLRASLLSTVIPARIKLGFDRARHDRVVPRPGSRGDGRRRGTPRAAGDVAAAQVHFPAGLPVRTPGVRERPAAAAEITAGPLPGARPGRAETPGREVCRAWLRPA